MPAQPSPNPASPPTHAQPKAHDFAALRDWPNYFRAVAGKPARQTLLDALALIDLEAKAADASVPADRVALDLGCGEGRDTAELLSRGWHVTSIDTSPLAFDLLRARIPEDTATRLTPIVGSFCDPAITWPDRLTLLNASYSLPFCPPDKFAGMWDRIVQTIPRGGRFSGQLFGNRDTWAVSQDMTFHTRAQLDGLFDGFLLESMKEVENDEPTSVGDPKHWHLYHIVAQKR